MNRGTDHTFSVTQTGLHLEGDISRRVVWSSGDMICVVSFMIKQCLLCSLHAQSQCLFVSMLTGAPTCNVSHMELRNEQKNVTNSSHVDLHHHPTAKNKGLRLPFHQPNRRALPLQHKICLCHVWYTTIFVSSCLSQAHSFVLVITTLSCCTYITLQNYCTALFSWCRLVCHHRHLRYISVFIHLESICLYRVLFCSSKSCKHILKFIHTPLLINCFFGEIIHVTVYSFYFMYWSSVILHTWSLTSPLGSECLKNKGLFTK